MIKTHHFQVDDAVLYGVEKAVLLNNLKYWLDHAKANGKKAIDGYHWTFNSATSFAELIPYIDSRKIGRLMRELEADGIVIVGNHNRAGYDRTKWYTMPEYALQPASPVIVQNVTVDCQNMDNALSQFEQPIPDINTDNKPDSNQVKNCEPSVNQFDSAIMLVIFDFWKEVMKKSGATKLDSKRKTAIKNRLKDGYTIEQIKLAIINCSLTPHNMGQNDRGQKFNDIELICRNATNLERFIEANPIQAQQQSTDFTGQQSVSNWADGLDKEFHGVNK